MIARVQEHPANEVERLLRTGGDQDVLRRDDDTVTARVPGDHVAEWHFAFRGAVLEGAGSVHVENTFPGVTELIKGKQIRSRQASRKRDHVRMGRQLQ